MHVICHLPHRPRHQKPTTLASPCLHLGSSALGTLLRDLLSVASCASSGGLGLLGLLLRLGGGLLLLALLDGCGTGSGTGLGALGAALLDHVEGGTDDGTLVLDSAASALLGDLLLASWLALSSYRSNTWMGKSGAAEVGRVIS